MPNVKSDSTCHPQQPQDKGHDLRRLKPSEDSETSDWIGKLAATIIEENPEFSAANSSHAIPNGWGPSGQPRGTSHDQQNLEPSENIPAEDESALDAVYEIGRRVIELEGQDHVAGQGAASSIALRNPVDIAPRNAQGKNYGYELLIAFCLVNHPTRHRTTADIYAWVATNFPYYNSNRKNWKAHLRNRLVTVKQDGVKVYERVERPGKYSGWWTFRAGMEAFELSRMSKSETASFVVDKDHSWEP